jgi:hypothetical protein
MPLVDPQRRGSFQSLVSSASITRRSSSNNSVERRTSTQLPPHQAIDRRDGRMRRAVANPAVTLWHRDRQTSVVSPALITRNERPPGVDTGRVRRERQLSD